MALSTADEAAIHGSRSKRKKKRNEINIYLANIFQLGVNSISFIFHFLLHSARRIFVLRAQKTRLRYNNTYPAPGYMQRDFSLNISCSKLDPTSEVMHARMPVIHFSCITLARVVLCSTSTTYNICVCVCVYTFYTMRAICSFSPTR